MPATALFAATLEQSINKVLALDSESESRLAELHGSRLIAFLSPMPFGITLVFSDRVDVLIEHDDFESVKAQLGPKDCCIKTSLDTLPELRETSQLTRLIQQKALYLEGELGVAQQVSGVFQNLDIDVEELLAVRTSDVFAHQSVKSIKALHQKVMSMLTDAGSVVGNAMVEEKKIAAHKLAVMHFSDEVSALRDSTERLDARLRDLEERFK